MRWDFLAWGKVRIANETPGRQSLRTIPFSVGWDHCPVRVYVCLVHLLVRDNGPKLRPYRERTSCNTPTSPNREKPAKAIASQDKNLPGY